LREDLSSIQRAIAGATTQGRRDGAAGSTVAERGGGNVAVASRSAMKGNSPSTAGEVEGKL
jgi:hypothetical protein